MFFYRGHGWWAVMIPLGLALAANLLLPRLGFDIQARDAYWIYGVALIVGGVAVFGFGRRVNGVTGGLLASYGKGRVAARHTVNNFPMEHIGPVAILLGLVVVAWWVVHHPG